MSVFAPGSTREAPVPPSANETSVPPVTYTVPLALMVSVRSASPVVNVSVRLAVKSDPGLYVRLKLPPVSMAFNPVLPTVIELNDGVPVVLTDWSNQSFSVGLPLRVIVLFASPVVSVSVLAAV